MKSKIFLLLVLISLCMGCEKNDSTQNNENGNGNGQTHADNPFTGYWRTPDGETARDWDTWTFRADWTCNFHHNVYSDGTYAGYSKGGIYSYDSKNKTIITTVTNDKGLAFSFLITLVSGDNLVLMNTNTMESIALEKQFDLEIDPDASIIGSWGPTEMSNKYLQYIGRATCYFVFDETRFQKIISGTTAPQWDYLYTRINDRIILKKETGETDKEYIIDALTKNDFLILQETKDGKGTSISTVWKRRSMY